MTCKDCVYEPKCANLTNEYFNIKLATSKNVENNCTDFLNRNDYKRVVHAKWIANIRQKFTNSNIAAIDENGNPFIKKKLVKFIHYKCSSCNEVFDDNSLYCPECGAKMDLE